LLLLLLFLAVTAAIDAWRKRKAATRWREYSFLLAAGALGSVFGIAVDHLTATLSPEYFILGKGLDTEAGFRGQVTRLGMHAGFSAGIVIGGLLLLANNARPDCPALPYRRLLRLLGAPIVAAVALAPFSAAVLSMWDPLDFRGQLAGLLSESQADRFAAVWGVHVGLYLGGLVGAAYAVRALRRQRRTAGRGRLT
jgi:hypothetical protein